MRITIVFLVGGGFCFGMRRRENERTSQGTHTLTFEDDDRGRRKEMQKHFDRDSPRSPSLRYSWQLRSLSRSILLLPLLLLLFFSSGHLNSFKKLFMHSTFFSIDVLFWWQAAWVSQRSSNLANSIGHTVNRCGWGMGDSVALNRAHRSRMG